MTVLYYVVLHYIVHFVIVVILYCIILYNFSDNCIQSDDGQIRNG